MEGLFIIVGVLTDNCLDSCRSRLASWNKTEFGHMGRQITWLEKELQALEQSLLQDLEQIHEVHKALNYWLDAENTM